MKIKKTICRWCERLKNTVKKLFPNTKLVIVTVGLADVCDKENISNIRSSIRKQIYLKDFNGYVHSDGYSGYNKLAGIIRCGCWAHIRRKFIEAIPFKKTGTELTTAEISRDYCNQLFEIESRLKDLS